MFKEIDTFCSEKTHIDELTKKVFKPGNLVWGTYVSRNSLYNILDKGILPSQATGNSHWGRYVDHICFGLLENSEFPHNYMCSCDMGPKINGRSNNIGIIINKDSLLIEYGQQLRAVGNAFLGKSQFSYLNDRFDADYTFKDKDKYIFDIQVSEPLHLGVGYFPWETEICLYGKSYGTNNEFKDIEIPTTFWEGMVVEKNFKNRFNVLLDYFSKDKIKNLPIFVLKDND